MSALDEWKENYSMDPEDYLDRYPDGDGAELAQAAVEKKQGADSVDIGGHECEVGSWKGQTQYHCPACPDSRLDKDKMEAHLSEHEEHELEGQDLKLDRFGNSVNEGGE